MIEADDQDKLTLSTGKQFYANRGIIGIDKDLDVSEGYDGGIEILRDDQEPFYSDGLEPKEVVELCDFMIKRWGALRQLAIDSSEHKELQIPKEPICSVAT